MTLIDCLVFATGIVIGWSYSSYRKRQRKANPPKEAGWNYLGLGECHWVNNNGKKTSTHIFHFWARGPKLEERKVETRGTGYEDHTWYQKEVLRWEKGDSVWRPIQEPSDFFKDWTAQNHGNVWSTTTKWWVPMSTPAPKQNDADADGDDTKKALEVTEDIITYIADQKEKKE